MLFTGLAAAKGIAVAATPTTAQPVATTGSAATMSSDAQPLLITGSSALTPPLTPLFNALFGCTGSVIQVCGTPGASGVG
ncbi:hypothetical protein [Nocardia tengchongensis]